MAPRCAMTRRVGAVLAAGLAAFGPRPMAPTGAIAAEVTETAVKATYLYKFSFFVEWPSAAFTSPDSPFNICIVGHDPFGATLDASIKGQKVQDHPIVVKRESAISRESGCHIAYFANAEPVPVAKVLTITDSDSSGGQSGIINFVVKDSRVRFVIDDAAAALGGLAIDSRLLNLALVVKPRR